MKARIHKLLCGGTGLIVFGLVYAAFCNITGWALSCPFYRVTGLLCPGCGVTRACLSLLRGDLAAAWGYNPGLVAVLPLLLLLCTSMAVRYVKTGSNRLVPVQSLLMWGIAGWLLLWGVLRNINLL